MTRAPNPELENIIALCLSASRAEQEKGWRRLLDRYGGWLESCVAGAVKRWRMPRLGRQMPEACGDILADVFKILLAHLGDFRETGSEAAFRSWLAVICNRAAGRYIRREFSKRLGEDDAAEYTEFAGGLDDDHRWELYEKVVQTLYDSAGPRPANTDRDINIFMLYAWADLSAPMVFRHPCYREEGHRVVDVVVNRLRKKLREKLP